MTVAQKIILIALAAVGLIASVVGFSLMHYIGGFMRTIEEEARKEAEDEDDRDKAPPDGISEQYSKENRSKT